MNMHSIDEYCSSGKTESQMLEQSAKHRDPLNILGKAGVPLLQDSKESFAGDRKDSIFALIAFILGFFFARWVLFSWQGWGVTLFTVGYCSIVTMYLLKKGVHIPQAGWFWLTAVVLVGISYSLWSNNGLEPWRNMFLFCGAVYWVICATGLPILGKTSNWIVLDGLNGLLVIPFRNFGCQYKSLAFLGGKNRVAVSQIFSIALGLLLAFIVAGMVLPLLMEADSGGFSKIANGVLAYFQGLQNEVVELFAHVILAIPIAAYLFGLVAGSAHRRGCATFKKDVVEKAIYALRVLPTATVFTLLGLVCSLYVVFIGSQLPYYFSAFVGERPEGWQVYSEYARSGFFELCRIAAINLTLLAGANILSKQPRQDNTVLKILNGLLALLTLLLIATAMSKMTMYIGVYGLSVRRLLPCLFMIFLAVICGGVAALQKWQFSIVRLAAGVGVVMLCTLCLLNPDGLVARYNAERYLSGTLSSFDVEILYRGGPAGVDPALKVYAETADQALQAELRDYLLVQQQRTVKLSGNTRDNLQNARARQRIAEFFVLNPAEGLSIKPYD